MKVEDLKSTNGTFVNGVKLVAPHPVTMSDEITLGQSIPLPWPDNLQSKSEQTPDFPATIRETKEGTVSEPRVVTIGRNPENDVVLPDNNVSGFHAKLTIDGDTMELEDVGSTNGTSVGGVENKIQTASVSSEETVYFGSKAYRVTELLRKAGVPTEEISSSSAASVPSVPQLSAVLATFGIVVLLGMMLFGREESAEPEPEEPPQASLVTGNHADPHEADDRDLPPVPENSTQNEVESQLSEDERLNRSLFIIVASDPAEKTPFRVGTGFAIGPNRVATSGSVISILNDLKENGFSQAYLMNPAFDQKFTIEAVEQHPGYQEAHRKSLEAREDYEILLQQHNVDEPSSKLPKPVLSMLETLRETALSAIERKTSSDVAVIEIREALDVWLELADPDSSLRPNLKIQVRGMAFDYEDPFYDPELSTDPVEMDSRIRKLMTVDPDTPPRLLATGTPQQQEWAFYGSPVLNPNNEVIAVYSRSTPSSENEESDSSAETFDAPLAARIRECLQLTNP